MAWGRYSFAPDNVKNSLHRYTLAAMVLSLSACVSGQHAQEPASTPVVKTAKASPTKPVGKETEIIPPEPPLPAEESPLGRRKKGHRPYYVRGKTYYPLVTAKGYEERGVACWYGPSFHGHKTSSGEMFDMYGISAAHKLLPMHTNVEVTNLENGKSITLKINDRGPFVAGRVIDLSYGAAKELAMLDNGLARVLIRTCGSVEGHKKNDILGEFFVHVGSFEQKSDAISLLEDMKALRYKPWRLRVIKADREGSVLWRVELGPYKSMTHADTAHMKVLRDYPSAFVVAK